MDTGYHKYRRYDEQFKRSAVELVESTRRPMAQIANELGIPYKTLEKWRSQFHKREPTGSPPGAPASAEQLAAQLREAQRQLAYVERERDILKKALAICSREGQAKPGSS